MLNQLAYNWWTVGLRGLLAIIVGVIALFFPVVTLVFLIALFGCFALLEGLFLLVAGIRSRKSNQRWWALILQGILGLGAGALAFLAPMATAIALIYLVAVWAVASGVIEIIAAIRLRKAIEGEWLLILDGAVTIIFGLALALAPNVGLLVWMWMIGGFKLASGILLIILAFKLKKFRRDNVASLV
jgi:uncharacterized membrane protein HdeD (DUF308 family)